MAEEHEDESTESTKAGKSKSKLILIVIGVLLVVIVGGGFFVWKKMGSTNSAEAVTEEKGHDVEKEGKGDGEGEKGVSSELLAMEPFLVNLQEKTGTRYLKVSVQLELDSSAVEEAKNSIPRIRDSIIILLSSKGYADVGSVQGKYQLRDEIAARVNKILTKGKVRGVYFTEFVIQ